jgi:hypothetical protein
MKNPIIQLMLYFIPAPLVLLAFMAMLLLQCKTVAPHENSLRAGKTILFVDPAVGARIVSLKYGDYELLTPESVFPENFGSTLWTAPQSDWGWPPFDTLDNKPYKRISSEKGIHLVSGECLKSGFQMEKHFDVIEADSSILINYSIKNITNLPRSVGPWEVTRVAPGGISFFPADADSAIMERSNLPGVSVSNGIVWFDYDFDKITFHSKLFAMGSGGWQATMNHGLVFIKVFGDRPSSAIAPGQGEIEIYANGEQKYIEVENHGDYRLLQPGESVKYTVRWMVRTVPVELQKTENRVGLVEWVVAQL